jgi:hypothetical protein
MVLVGREAHFGVSSKRLGVRLRPAWGVETKTVVELNPCNMTSRNPRRERSLDLKGHVIDDRKGLTAFASARNPPSRLM